jgi:hypothetical protein
MSRQPLINVHVTDKYRANVNQAKLKNSQNQIRESNISVQNSIVLRWPGESVYK